LAALYPAATAFQVERLVAVDRNDRVVLAGRFVRELVGRDDFVRDAAEICLAGCPALGSKAASEVPAD
jgi:hypothetical protein